MRLCCVPQMLSLCVCTSWKDLLYLHSLQKIRMARPQKYQIIRDTLEFEIVVFPRYDNNRISSASIPDSYLVLNAAKKIVHNAWRKLHSKYLQDYQVSFVLMPEIWFSEPLRKKQKIGMMCEKSNENSYFVLDCQSRFAIIFLHCFGEQKANFLMSTIVFIEYVAS